MSDPTFDLYASQTGDNRHALPFPVTVDSYGASVLGGSTFMEARSASQPHDTHEALEALGNRVEVLGPDGRVQWSGIIRMVEGSEARRHALRTLDRVFNRIRVAYRFKSVATGATLEGLTAWQENADSIERFGIRELIVPASDLRPEAATLYAQTLLAQWAWPDLEYLLSGSGQGVAFVGIGWADTLDWQHYTRDGGEVRHEQTKGSVRIGQPTVVDTGIGFLKVGQVFLLYDLDAGIGFVAKDRLVVTGTTDNNSTFTVRDDAPDQDGTARTFTDDTIGFHSVFGVSKLYDLAGGLQSLREGEVIEASSTIENNRAFRIEKNLNRVARSFTSSALVFWSGGETNGAVEDSGATGLFADILVGDIIRISGHGDAGHNGAFLVLEKRDDNYLVTDAGWSAWGTTAAVLTVEAGNTLDLSEGAVQEVPTPADNVTIRAGKYYVVQESVTTEASGASVTLRPYAERLAQSFQLAAGDLGDWYLWLASIKARKIGHPTDSLKVGVYSNTAGAPGIEIGSALLDGDDELGPTLDWLEPGVDLGSAQQVADATTYWLVVERTGTADAANCYEIAIDESSGYAGGELKAYRGAAWSGYVPQDTEETAADMPFVLSGSLPIAALVEEITDGSQFITGLEIDADLTAHAAAYRPDAVRGRTALETLLAIGSDDGKRLCYEVTPDRRLRVYEEPDPGTADYAVLPDLTLLDAQENPVPFYQPIVGVHAVLRNGVAPYGNMAEADPARTFIESGEVNVAQAAYRLLARALPVPPGGSS